MKKTLLFILALAAAVPCVQAQSPKIEKSERFDEPSAGWNKVLQLKNGNTVYFHMARKEGIEVTIYDKNRKQLSNATIESEELNEKKNFNIVGLYEINKEPVLFVMQAEHRTPTLYRLRFDPNKGTLIKEEELGSLPKISLLAGYKAEAGARPLFSLAPATPQTPVTIPNIIVEKDPNSDAYAVIYFNAWADEPDERIKVIHYNGDHNILNIGYYESPEKNFKYLRFIGAVVDGTKRLYIAAYGAASMKGKDAHVYIARLNSSDSTFTNKKLDFTEDFKDTKSVMIYNRTSGNIQLLTMSLTGTRVGFLTNKVKKEYTSFISVIDPETLTLKGVKPATNDKVTEYAQKKLQLDMNYTGLPHQMVVNADNSTTVLSESLSTAYQTNSKGQVTSIKTYLGAIGVTDYNEDGTEKTGYLFNKQQEAIGVISPLYISARSKGVWTPVAGYRQARNSEHNSYLSFDYVNTDKSKFILFNDDPKNFEKDEDDRKRKVARKIGRLSTVFYSLNNGTVSKSLPFVDEKDDDIYGACLVETSDFRREDNTYATVLIEHDNKDTYARIVWLTFP